MNLNESNFGRLNKNGFFSNIYQKLSKAEYVRIISVWGAVDIYQKL